MPKKSWNIFVFCVCYGRIFVIVADNCLLKVVMELTIPVSEDGTPLRGALDSSTAIILYNSGLLELFCSGWDLITTDAVYKEINQGMFGKEISCILKTSSAFDAASIEGIFGKGENSILNLYREGKAGIIFSDDRSSALTKYLKIKDWNIPAL